MSFLVVVRDFAYPPDSPLHFGRNALTALDNQSAVSLSSPDFNGRDARALFDFTPETEYEIVLKAGQTIWVQYRQCPVRNLIISFYTLYFILMVTLNRAGLLQMYKMRLV